jgi:HPt (histidine-containing phosphotransfer) domain-containing protein
VTPREETTDEVISSVESKPLLDVADMSTRVGGDRNFVRELLDISSTQLPLMLEKLRVTLSRGDDAASLHMQAHTMKGVASNISALALSDICLRVENAAEDGDIKTVRELLPELEQVVALTIEAIKNVVTV